MFDDEPKNPFSEFRRVARAYLRSIVVHYDTTDFVLKDFKNFEKDTITRQMALEAYHFLIDNFKMCDEYIRQELSDLKSTYLETNRPMSQFTSDFTINYVGFQEMEEYHPNTCGINENRLVFIKGLINGVSPQITLITKKKQCVQCGASYNPFLRLRQCRKDKMPLEIITSYRTFIQFFVQQIPDYNPERKSIKQDFSLSPILLETFEYPEKNAFFWQRITQKDFDGMVVEATGICIQPLETTENEKIVNPVLLCKGIKFFNRIQVSKKDLEYAKQWAESKGKELLNCIDRELFHKIRGHRYERKLLILSAYSNERSHTILMGNPASAKTMMAETCLYHYGHGDKTSVDGSRAGLTGGNERINGQMVVKKGKLNKDNALFVIDEFARMVKNHGQGIVDTLLRFLEGDIIISLQASGTWTGLNNNCIICSNPLEGDAYDPEKPFKTQLDIDGAFFSRIDYPIPIMQDNKDPEVVRDIINHQQGFSTIKPELTPIQLRAVLHYLRRKERPTYTKEAHELLADKYIEYLRSISQLNEAKRGKAIGDTPRFMNTMRKTIQNYAVFTNQPKLTKEVIDEAIELLYAGCVGKIINMFGSMDNLSEAIMTAQETKLPKSRNDKINLILSVLKKHPQMPHNDLIKKIHSYHIDSSEAERLIQALIKEDQIKDPTGRGVYSLSDPESVTTSAKDLFEANQKLKDALKAEIPFNKRTEVNAVVDILKSQGYEEKDILKHIHFFIETGQLLLMNDKLSWIG